MEQRSLRLGDIVDDYCPRERRITNHAIVAIVEDAIRQTRCTTCDYEHQFKQAREPRRRKKGSDSLFDEVLADITGVQLVPPARAAEAVVPVVAAAAEPDALPVQAAADEDEMEAVDAAPEDGWPAHRTLIRATLPRTGDEPPTPRPIPEFTMHQKPPAPRGRGGFRFGQGVPDGFGNGRDGRSGRGSQQNGWTSGPRHGNGNGNGNGNGEQSSGNAPGSGRGRRRRGGKRPR